MSNDSNKKSILTLLPGRKLFLRFDHWLRINQPLVWRTKIHYFFLFSFLLLNPLLWLIAKSYPISIYNYPTVSELGLSIAVVVSLGVLVIIYWTFKQTKIPVGEQSFSFYLKTLGLYVLCIFFLMINSVVFLSPIIEKTGALIEGDSAFDEFYRFSEENGFWNFAVKVNNKNDLTLYSEMQKDQFVTSDYVSKYKTGLISYGILSNNEAQKMNCSTIQTDCTDEFITFSRMRGLDFNYQIEAKLKSLNEAQKYRRNEPNQFSDLYNWGLFLLISFVLGFSSLTTIYSHKAFRRDWLSGLSSGPQYNLTFSYANLIKKLDNYILINYPVMWSTKLHTYLIHAGLFILVCGAALLIDRLLFSDRFFVGFIQRELIEGNGILFMVMVFGIYFLSSLSWAYSQTKNKFIPLRYHENLYLVLVYIFILSLIPFFVLMIFSYLGFFSDQNTKLFLFLIPYFCIPFVTWVYSSKFTSSKKSIFYTLINLGVSIVFIYFMSLSEKNDLEIFFWTFLLLTVLPLFLIFLFLKMDKIKLATFFSIMYILNLAINIFLFFVKILDEEYADPITDPESSLFFGVLNLFITLFFITLFFTPAILALLKVRSMPNKI